MKKYKSNYMFTVMFQICNEFLAFIPGFTSRMYGFALMKRSRLFT